MIPTLTALSLTKSFGGLRAVGGISLDVYPGQILSVIGPNGAGKTTFFNCLTGIYRPDTGDIILDQETVTGLPPHEICRRGVARTFQNIRLFGEMTALENVMVGQFTSARTPFWDILWRTRRFHDQEKQARERARELLEQVGLGAHVNAWARNLAYGLQRRLEIARALATRPKVLLLDEPGAGMNPREIEEITALISQLKTLGLGILLIEHHMKVVMEISDRILVLDHGEKIAEGEPADIRKNPAVIAAYLGQEA